MIGGTVNPKDFFYIKYNFSGFRDRYMASQANNPYYGFVQTESSKLLAEAPMTTQIVTIFLHIFQQKDIHHFYIRPQLGKGLFPP